MAKIWRVYEGKEPTLGEAWAILPVPEAVSAFELKPDDFISDLATTPRPRFGDKSRDLSHLRYKRIVVEIDQKEGRQASWKPGYYLSPVNPEDALRRLIQQAFKDELGDENVARVKYESAIDSQGHEALKITVVIAPGVAMKLAKGASLSALVRLQERLSGMGENRTPIIDYATETELSDDAGS